MRTAADTLIFVTGHDCHLCEHGREVLGVLGVDAREISVDSLEAAVLVEQGIALTSCPF